MRLVFTAFVYLLLTISVVVAAAIFVIYTPVILLFGRDSPKTTVATYLFVAILPFLFSVAVTSIAVLSAHLWRSPHWKALGFMLALALCVGTLYAGYSVRPH